MGFASDAFATTDRPSQGIFGGLFNGGLLGTAGRAAVGLTGVGGVVGALGQVIAPGITDMLGLTSSQPGGEAVKAATDAMNNILGRGAEITKNSMYNAAGQTGADVGNTYAIKNDQLTNSAGAISTANAIKAAADKLNQSANYNTTIAQQSLGQQGNALRTNTMNQAAAAGVNPAAMAAMLKSLNSSMNQGGLQLLGQAGQQQMAASQGAGDLMGKAFSTLSADRALRFETDVKPWEAQVNQGVAGLAGNIASTVGQGALGQQQLDASTNPLAGYASALGQLGSGNAMNYFSQLIGGKNV